MDCQVESVLIELLSVKDGIKGVMDDLMGIERRLSALESSHRSLCNSHMDLEESYVCLNGSFEVVFRGTLKMLDEFLRCLSSSSVPVVLRFEDSVDVDGSAA
jgi:hypothetical protein